jgi:hypothetical protein
VADDAEAPVGRLRGAGVDVDVRRVGRAVATLCLLGLAVLVVVLFVAGAKKNAEITSLQQRGVPVEVTVTHCLGLMGGSGSNLVGYQCSGTFVLDRHRYSESLPGNAFHPNGAVLQAVSVPSDPGLVATTSDLAKEHTSNGVFVLPAVLLVVLLLALGVVVRRRGAGGVSVLVVPQRLRGEAGGV